MTRLAYTTLLGPVLPWVRALGGMAILAAQALSLLLRGSLDLQETVAQSYKVGVQSVPVLLATALLTGAIMVIMGEAYVAATGATSLVGWAAGTGVFTEIGPLLIGLMFSGRVGANTTAQIGAMKVTEQVDALRLLGIDPLVFLVIPRFVSMVFMLALLVAVCDAVALTGAATTANVLLGISYAAFWRSVVESHLLREFLMGIAKGAVFGGSISIVACYYGLSTEGGSAGVGRSVNDSVVMSAVLIFFWNFLVSLAWS